MMSGTPSGQWICWLASAAVNGSARRNLEAGLLKLFPGGCLLAQHPLESRLHFIVVVAKS